jgi:hypothetical protein
MTVQQYSSSGAGFARLFWMMLGPLVLLLLALSIVSQGRSWLTVTDFVFLACVLLLPLARWYEFRAGEPRTSTGDPATERDLRRYAAGALVIGAGIWIGANVLGVHVFD